MRSEESFRFVPGGQITEDRRRHDLNRQSTVLCSTCHETYACTQCGFTGPREDFQKKHFTQHFESKSLQCLACKEGRTAKKVKKCIVEVCGNFISHNRSSHKHRDRPLVCETCVEKGYTIKDTKTYTCTYCETSGGRRVFQDRDFQRAVAQGKQKCKTCSKFEQASVPQESSDMMSFIYQNFTHDVVRPSAPHTLLGTFPMPSVS